jgi:nucleotide-binding universal stress UspA family protein
MGRGVARNSTACLFRRKERKLLSLLYGFGRSARRLAPLWDAGPLGHGSRRRQAKERNMFQRILLPIDLADPNLAKPALDAAVMMAKAGDGAIHLVNVLAVTPAMLAEYVPPDFDAQQQKSAEEALAIIAREVKLDAQRVTSTVRQGTIYQEILDEAKTSNANLIVMSSHRAGVRTYFLGSVAGHVVRYATCSVLVVRR